MYIIIILFFSLNVLGQKDTLRKTYQNGNQQYIYPTEAGAHHGICTKWYENGQLWSEGNWINGKQDGLHVSYFNDGRTQLKTWFKQGEIRISKLYQSNGKRSLFGQIRPNHSRTKIWSKDGKRIFIKRERNGQAITCSAPFSFDDTEPTKEGETCFCGEVSVFWSNGVYRDSLGNAVNQNYKFKIKEWFENGSLKSKTEMKRGRGYMNEWDESGRLIKAENY